MSSFIFIATPLFLLIIVVILSVPNPIYLSMSSSNPLIFLVSVSCYRIKYYNLYISLLQQVEHNQPLEGWSLCTLHFLFSRIPFEKVAGESLIYFSWYVGPYTNFLQLSYLNNLRYVMFHDVDRGFANIIWTNRSSSKQEGKSQRS